ncbi:MAG: hypothetical protein JWO51_1659 [Rhodospirillales bacterium]|nr:hypothetical protein [Rhodospirillales bacterium]
MSLRLPRNLVTKPGPDTGAGVLEVEIRAEQAASLGRGGRDVAAALKRLRDFDAADSGPAARAELVAAAADAVWGFLIHRELCGLRDRDQVIRDYAIPAEVLCRLGAR